MTYVIGPDITESHIIGTVKMPGGTFETMVWRRDEPVATVDEVRNDTYDAAIMAHAIAWEGCKRLEEKGRLWSFLDMPSTPRKDPR